MRKASEAGLLASLVPSRAFNAVGVRGCGYAISEYKYSVAS
ncbi:MULTISPECIES: hypothetical protein [unclassified Fibrobacter]|nr:MULTISPECIES: hypothetical protein [unclassified Fibrobacter]